MDFVTQLPQTAHRQDAVRVIVDWLTKSAHFLAVQMAFTLEELSGYMECQSLSYRTGILELRHTFGRVSKRPWEHS